MTGAGGSGGRGLAVWGGEAGCGRRCRFRDGVGRRRVDGDGGSVAVGGGALPTMPVGAGQGAAATAARQ